MEFLSGQLYNVICSFTKYMKRKIRLWLTQFYSTAIPIVFLENRTPIFFGMIIWLLKYLFSQNPLQLEVTM